MATQALSIFYVRANGFMTKILPQVFSQCLVEAFTACAGDYQRAALASVSVRGTILNGAPQAAEVAALEIGRWRGVRQEYAADFTWGAAIYNWRNIYNFWFFRFWFVGADNASILNERFKGCKLFRWLV